MFAHSLGLWERLSGVAHMAHLGDQLAGLAQLIAEANGTAGIAHIKDKITDIVLYATMTRACLEAALGNVEVNADGMMIAERALHERRQASTPRADYAVMVRRLHDIAGGTVATGPASPTSTTPRQARTSRSTCAARPGVIGRERMALFHAIRNMTADEWGGREAVSWLQSGGGLFAQRTVTRHQYDMDHAKQLARQLAVRPMADGPVAIVSGGTRGIGRAITERLLADGWSVLATYCRQRHRGQGTGRRAIERLGGSSFRRAPRRRLRERGRSRPLARFGQLDHVVAAAGITRNGAVAGLSDEDWDAVIATNLSGTFRMARAALRPVTASPRGRIVMISSVAATMGNANQGAYAASKAGLLGFAQTLPANWRPPVPR